MAKVVVPSCSTTACDVCQRVDTYLTRCEACGCEYCMRCHGVVPGSQVNPDVCRACADTPAVLEICRQFAPGIVDIVKRRQLALNALVPPSEET